MIAGLDATDEGSVVTRVRRSDQMPCGMVYQEVDACLLPWRTNLANATLALEIGGHSRDKREALARDVVERFSLPVPLDRKPSTSSGGERQMVCILRAALASPAVLILDEPFSRLDPSSLWTWRRFVRRFTMENHCACMVITHNPDDALLVADDVHIMWRLGAEGSRIRCSLEVQTQAERDADWLETEECSRLRAEIRSAFDRAYRP